MLRVTCVRRQLFLLLVLPHQIMLPNGRRRSSGIELSPRGTICTHLPFPSGHCECAHSLAARATIHPAGSGLLFRRSLTKMTIVWIDFSLVSSDIRQRYVEEIRINAKVRSAALLQAFAEVPREELVGHGPWKVLSRPPGHTQAQVAEVADPAERYRDVAVLLDPSRNLTNGNPACWPAG
jgi:hypothetical protein